MNPVQSLSVLIAEDSPSQQMAFQKVLESRGHRVTVTTDERSLLKKLSTGEFNVVVFDLETSDDFQSCQAMQILEQNSGRHTPTIALVATSAPIDRQHMQEAGIDCCLTKPVDVEVLIPIVEATVNIANRNDRSASETGHSPVSGSPIANWDATMKRLGGDASLFQFYVDVYREDVPQYLDDLKSAVSSGDFAAVAHAAHSLRGLAANFDAVIVAEWAAVLESAGKRKDLSDAASMLTMLEAALNDLDQALVDFRSQST